MNNKEQKFYSILQDLFVGAKLEGDSGYVNLMNIKTEYFKKIEKNLKSEMKKKFGEEKPEDLYDKLYTFFDSYISDGGAIFFSSTPVYKNIYSKVYSDREDTALFWKTAKLYYVKSEANYKSIDNLQLHGEPEIAFDFQFDASLLKHKQANEKKELEFYFTGVKTRKGKKVIKLHVLYKNDNKYTVLEEKLKAKGKDAVIKSLFNNIEKLPSGIILKNEGLDLERINLKGDRGSVKAEFIVSKSKNNKTKIEITPAIVGEKEIEKYLRLKGINLSEEEIKKAYRVYKKQTEIDYFIHKDAKGFLREQFDLFIYQYLANDLDSLFKQEDLDRIKKLKEIAYQTIEYIGNFEDELKKMWLKPKFARKSNYVVTLDRLADKTSGIKVIEKIINHKNFKDQVGEWIELGIAQKDFNKKEILAKEKLNDKWSKLPIDTKFFKDIEIEIIGLFNNLDEELDGRLIKSDNFQALNTLLPKYKGEVQTIFIDPPFNKAESEQFSYIANYKDSSWMSLLENRLELSKDILKLNGSIFVNCDDLCDSFTRLLLDKIFVNFQNEIIWCYEKPGAGLDKLKNNHSNIYFYTKNEKYLFNTIFVPRKGETELTKSSGRHSVDYEGKISPDWWIDIPSFATAMTAGERSVKMLGIQFPTQLPEKLLERVLKAGSNEGDLIMDYFGGSAVTGAVAQKIRRKWMIVELGEQFYTIDIPRLKIVLAGDKSGVSKNNNWQGGGFFKYYELEQYEDVLKNASYKPNENKLENIDFSLSEKQARDGMEIDFKKEKARFTFEKLYPDVDVAETISNLEGKKIKKILKDKVVFEDDTEIDLNNLDFEKHKNLQKLIYW